MRDPHLWKWQTITLITLWVGYAGFYVCRSNLSVSGSAIQSELTEQELREYGPAGSASKAEIERAEIVGKDQFGMILSWGTFFYAFGKFCNGMVGDFLGGRRMFLTGMFGSVACTVAFGMGFTLSFWIIVWALNRLIQSMGWVALVKVSSRWYPVHRHGSILGILSMSYLFGDAFARFFLGGVMKLDLWMGTDFGWRGVFYVSAATLGTIATVACFTLKSSPEDVGATEPLASPINVFGLTRGNATRPDNLWDLLIPLLTSFPFWLVCLVSIGLTLIRETFNNWNPIYLTEVCGMGQDDAALASGLFPFVGGVSALVVGYTSDVFSAGKRSHVMVPCLALLVLALAALGYMKQPQGAALPLVLTSLVAFLLIGPYSFLSGAMALEFGGKRGSASAAGIVDGLGYLAGIVSGYGIAKVAGTYGWSIAFYSLAGVATATLLVAILYWVVHESGPAPAAEVDAD
jgi:OPA family glycerol-3-phosphate transporter-like MFS transporter